MSALRIDAHGGYLVRAETLEGVAVQTLARAALQTAGEAPEAAALLVSFDGPRRLVRLAYDGPHTYGPAGARWYRDHQALAAALSLALPVQVHAYAFDPDAFETVTCFGAGRAVGGETLAYDEADEDVEALSETAFDALRAGWPMGRLAQLLGLTREELLRLPYLPGVLLPLEGEPVDLRSLFQPTRPL